MSTSITYKRGDTFAPALAVTENNVAVDITGWTISSQIRTPDDVLVADLAVSNRDNAAGTYTLSPTVDYPETGWPVGILHWDIQYNDGTVFSTQTIVIRCEKDITR